jgi:hypothetical protein
MTRRGSLGKTAIVSFPDFRAVSLHCDPDRLAPGSIGGHPRSIYACFDHQVTIEHDNH